MVWLLLLIAASAIHAATVPVEFTERVIASDLVGGSQVVVADLNKDGKPDIITIASGKTDLIWYENPSWKRHVLAVDLRQMSDVAVRDVDGDGIPEVVVAHEFADQPANSLGIISVLQHGIDPREPWKITEIDRIPTSHRLRWADVFGNGVKMLVNAPLIGPKPDGKTPLVLYKPGIWMRETIPQPSEGAVRGIYITDWDGDGAEDILTAGYTGIHVFRRSKDGAWSRTEIVPAPAADVAAGWLGSKPVGTRFLAALSTQIFVFRQDNKGKWQQQTIDDTFLDGGAILTADLNGDGSDEIVAGYRGQGRGVNVYYANSNKTWTKYPLDNGGIAAADCAVADLNADGRPDVVCIGSDSANLKWYENKGPKK